MNGKGERVEWNPNHTDDSYLQCKTSKSMLIRRISSAAPCLLFAGSGEEAPGPLIIVNIILGVILILILLAIAYEFAIALRHERGTQKDRTEIEKTINKFLSGVGITMMDGGEKIDEQDLCHRHRENANDEKPSQNEP